jgi:hypothetical protein
MLIPIENITMDEAKLTELSVDPDRRETKVPTTTNKVWSKSCIMIHNCCCLKHWPKWANVEAYANSNLTKGNMQFQSNA